MHKEMAAGVALLAMVRVRLSFDALPEQKNQHLHSIFISATYGIAGFSTPTSLTVFFAPYLNSESVLLPPQKRISNSIALL